MECRFTITMNKPAALPIDPNPDNYFPRKRWGRVENVILPERAKAYSRTGELVTVGGSGVVVHVTTGLPGCWSSDYKTFDRGCRIEDFPVLDGIVECEGEMDPLPRPLVSVIREEVDRFCRKFLSTRQKRLLVEPLTRRTCSAYVAGTAGVVRLLELYETEAPDVSRETLLARHAGLLVVIDHRIPSPAEKCRAKIGSLFLSKTEGTLVS